MEVFAKNIKKLIKNQGLTHVKFCEIVGITRDAFYQQMRANSLTINSLERYAKALNIPVWRLMMEDDEAAEYLKDDKMKGNNENDFVITCPNCGKVIKMKAEIKE